MSDPAGDGASRNGGEDGATDSSGAAGVTTDEAWENWSGSVTFEPDRLLRPGDEAALQSIVRECARAGETVRVVGEGHSWTPLVETDDVLVSLERMSGVVDHDPDANTATIRAGTTLEDAGTTLHERGLAFPNLGDVSMQLVAGAFATGTHGSGATFENLAGALAGGRMVTGTGEVVDFDGEESPELLEAVRVSLGSLGIFTELDLDLVPTYKLQRREYCTSFEAFAPHWERLVEENRNFDLYWYPRSDEVKMRLLNPPGGGTEHAAIDFAELVTNETGWWHLLIPSHNDIGREFEEMEYAVPREVGEACFREVRDRVRDRWRADVGWRMLVRTVAADEAYLSTDYQRATTTISCIQNAELAYWDYFEDLEPILLEYDGRPHWGKHHTLRADELRERYPEWDRFQAYRRELDPEGTFETDYLADLLGPVEAIDAEERGRVEDVPGTGSEPGEGSKR